MLVPPLLVHLAPLIFGIVVGTAANFGLELDRGAAPPRYRIIAHVLMLGLLGLLAWVAAELSHAGIHLRALFGAAAGLGGAKLARRFRDWGDREAERRLPLDPPPGDK